MKLGRIFIAGIVSAVLGAIVGGFCCGGIFNWVYKLEPTNVWRAMENIPWIRFHVLSVGLHIILAFSYALLNRSLPGANKLIKGLTFGLIIWLVGILPGMLATHAFMTVANTVVIYWTIIGLFTSLLNGIVIAIIYGEAEKCSCMA